MLRCSIRCFALQPRDKRPFRERSFRPLGRRAGQRPALSPVDLTPSRPVYDGKLGELYGIYLRHLTLMVLTLGWSRFWGRTRLRRYLWNHVSILGDRFEYRGRGIELLIGFVLVLAMLGGLGRADVAGLGVRLPRDALPGFGFLNLFYLSIVFIGIPLAFVGQYAGLRYKLSRTRWRGIRCGMAGSAWSYGGLATVLNIANAVTGQLLTPLVSVNLARPRIANAFVGTQRFDFAGSAGDIYGRYLGYYFLNIFVWMRGDGRRRHGGDRRRRQQLGFTAEEVAKLVTAPSLRTVLLLLIAAASSSTSCSA